MNPEHQLFKATSPPAVCRSFVVVHEYPKAV